MYSYAGCKYNKATVMNEFYRLAGIKHGIVSNALVLVGKEYHKCVERAFFYIVKPYRGEFKARMIICENNSFRPGTYDHLLREREKFFYSEPFHRHVDIYEKDVDPRELDGYDTSHRFEDLDFCASLSKVGGILVERLRNQSKIRYYAKKAMLFTFCERGVSRQEAFCFLRDKFFPILNAKLEGVNGELNRWLIRSEVMPSCRGNRCGEVFSSITDEMGRDCKIYRHILNFTDQGRVLDTLLFSYCDVDDIGHKTSPMIAGMVVYE